MTISPYVQINRIEFMVTYQCSGHCKHCSVGEKLNLPGGIKHVPVQSAVSAVEELARLFPITSVMTFGGEPLLYADVVCAIHEAATRCGIGTRQLITNGYFTKDGEKRRQTAAALAMAGVNNLLLSADAFHQETIPLEAVHHFARCAMEADIPGVKLHPAWVVDEQHDNPFNSRTKEIIAQFADLALPSSKGNNIFMAGNAAKHLAQYYDRPVLNMSDLCGSMPYTEPLTKITSLFIAPNGDVMVCGFVIGNIHTENVRQIVARYDPYQNEAMNAVVTGGVSALLALAKERGVTVESAQCHSVCDVCRRINAALTINEPGT